MKKKQRVSEKTIRFLERMYEMTGGNDFTIDDIPKEIVTEFQFQSWSTFMTSFFRYGKRLRVWNKFKATPGRNTYHWLRNPSNLRRGRKQGKTQTGDSARQRSVAAPAKSRVQKPAVELIFTGPLAFSDEERAAFDLLGETCVDGAETGNVRVKKSFFDAVGESEAKDLVARGILVSVGVGTGLDNQVWEVNVDLYRRIAGKLKAREEYLNSCGFPDVRRLTLEDVGDFSVEKLELLVQYLDRILVIASNNREIVCTALTKRIEDDKRAAGEFFQDLAKSKKIPDSVLTYLQRNPDAVKDIIAGLPPSK